MIKIKENAIFIADSHYNDKTKHLLLSLLKEILNDRIECSQLILMGDIFDFLAVEIMYFQNINHEAINLINEISYIKQVVYLEGNHDFNLKKLFPNSFVIPRDIQPIQATLNSQTLKLSHGDIYIPFFYNLYTSIIRNHFVLKFLNFIDFNYWLTYKISQNLMKKDICKPQKDFDQFVEKRIKIYKTDLVIEGHFHQGYLSKNYINIPSLCCNKQYMVFKENQFTFHNL
ncbi:MAG: metallophosphoesterase [Campylobacterales bacterium]|nr:metallophosphoesterase [Campylobacterales bacterium]